MSSSYRLAERAVLMRLSIGLPGENRQDKPMSDTVKSEHSLGKESGKWVKKLFPEDALAPIKKLDNEARAYHAMVTLPFDAGIGILPGTMIAEYSEKMREYVGQRDNLVQTHFLAQYDRWVDWARAEHNGTFDSDNYPGVDDAKKRFCFRIEPLPVPESGHFEQAMSSLLGLDADSVDSRVRSAMVEAQKELLHRMIDPVTHMAHKLAGKPCPCSGCRGKASKTGGFKDSLVENVKVVADLVPKLNLAGDPALDAFAAEMLELAKYQPDILRDETSVRAEAAAKAEALFTRLAGYKL